MSALTGERPGVDALRKLEALGLSFEFTTAQDREKLENAPSEVVIEFLEAVAAGLHEARS